MFAAETLKSMRSSGNTRAQAKSDSATFPRTIGIIPPSDGAVTYTNADTGLDTVAPLLLGGTTYPIACTAIKSSGTTATDNFVLLFPSPIG